MSDTYMKDGAEFYSVNHAPTNKDLHTNPLQALAVAQWEMDNFEGQVGTDTALALVKHLREKTL